jgi:hypothetical protein
VGSGHRDLAVENPQARPDGRFAVTVLNGSERSDVPVSTGLYSDTLVQVSGLGITAGAKVLVAP